MATIILNCFQAQRMPLTGKHGVSVVESVVDLESAREKRQKA
jgi:hypothetical protein